MKKKGLKKQNKRTIVTVCWTEGNSQLSDVWITQHDLNNYHLIKSLSCSYTHSAADQMQCCVFLESLFLVYIPPVLVVISTFDLTFKVQRARFRVMYYHCTWVGEVWANTATASFSLRLTHWALLTLVGCAPGPHRIGEWQAASTEM